MASEIGFDNQVRQDALTIIHAPQRKIEYRLCARLGIPSVAAIVHELAARFPDLKKHDSFKQWVGAEVAKEMRPQFEVVQPRGRVPWCAFFTYGAVWGEVSPPSGKIEPTPSTA